MKKTDIIALLLAGLSPVEVARHCRVSVAYVRNIKRMVRQEACDGDAVCILCRAEGNAKSQGMEKRFNDRRNTDH